MRNQQKYQKVLTLSCSGAVSCVTSYAIKNYESIEFYNHLLCVCFQNGVGELHVNTNWDYQIQPKLQDHDRGVILPLLP